MSASSRRRVRLCWAHVTPSSLFALGQDRLQLFSAPKPSCGAGRGMGGWRLAVSGVGSFEEAPRSMPGACPSSKARQKAAKEWTSMLLVLMFVHARGCYGHWRGPSHAWSVVAAAMDWGSWPRNRTSKVSSESRDVVPPVQYARGFSSCRVLQVSSCAFSRAGSGCELRVERIGLGRKGCESPQ